MDVWRRTSPGTEPRRYRDEGRVATGQASSQSTRDTPPRAPCPARGVAFSGEVKWHDVGTSVFSAIATDTHRGVTGAAAVPFPGDHGQRVTSSARSSAPRCAIAAADACIAAHHLDPIEATLDHVYPVARGGAHAPGNIVVACAPCNRMKGDMLPHEFFARYPQRGGELRALCASRSPGLEARSATGGKPGTRGVGSGARGLGRGAVQAQGPHASITRLSAANRRSSRSQASIARFRGSPQR